MGDAPIGGTPCPRIRSFPRPGARASGRGTPDGAVRRRAGAAGVRGLCRQSGGTGGRTGRPRQSALRNDPAVGPDRDPGVAGADAHRHVPPLAAAPASACRGFGIRVRGAPGCPAGPARQEPLRRGITRDQSGDRGCPGDALSARRHRSEGSGWTRCSSRPPSPRAGVWTPS